MIHTRSSPARTAVTLLLVAVLAAAGAVLASPARAAAPFCGLYWGSMQKQAEARGWPQEIVDVRAGRHACFDRMVVDLAGDHDRAGYRVGYVDVVRQGGSGFPLPTRGGAALQVVVTAAAHDEDYRATFLPEDADELVDVTGWRTFRQIADGGTYEGLTTYALGVRARLPFRVFTLAGAPGAPEGSRLVVDVAHRW